MRVRKPYDSVGVQIRVFHMKLFCWGPMSLKVWFVLSIVTPQNSNQLIPCNSQRSLDCLRSLGMGIMYIFLSTCPGNDAGVIENMADTMVMIGNNKKLVYLILLYIFSVGVGVRVAVGGRALWGTSFI